MSWVAHVTYLLAIVIAACAGILGGILIDQRFIVRPDAEVRTVVKQIEIAVPDCSAHALKMCWKKKTG